MASRDVYVVGSIVVAAGGAMTALSPLVGPLIVIAGLCIVWYGVRHPRSATSSDGRTGMDLQGGSAKLRNVKIRQQDKSIETKDTDVDADGVDIE